MANCIEFRNDFFKVKNNIAVMGEEAKAMQEKTIENNPLKKFEKLQLAKKI